MGQEWEGCDGVGGVQIFAGAVPELKFHELLLKFGEEARLDGTYFFCQQDNLLELARMLEQVQCRPPPPPKLTKTLLVGVRREISSLESFSVFFRFSGGFESCLQFHKEAKRWRDIEYIDPRLAWHPAVVGSCGAFRMS